MQTTELKNYVDLYESVQDIRIALSNRISPNSARNKDNGKQNDEFVDFCKGTLKQLDKLEKSTIENLTINSIILKKEYEPIYRWLTQNKGIGHTRALGLIAYIYPIDRFSNISKLWAYSGFGVMDICQTCNKRHVESFNRAQWIDKTASRLQEQNDKKTKMEKDTPENIKIKAEKMLCSCDNPDIKRIGQRRLKGQLADFNPKLKKQVYLCVDSFVKNGSLYKKYYRECKDNYLNRPDLKTEMDKRKGGISKGTGHIDAMARRKVAKLFLSHLWTVWRELEGLAVTDPYIIGVGGHADIILPEISVSDIDYDSKITVKLHTEEEKEYRKIAKKAMKT